MIMMRINKPMLLMLLILCWIHCTVRSYVLFPKIWNRGVKKTLPTAAILRAREMDDDMPSIVPIMKIKKYPLPLHSCVEYIQHWARKFVKANKHLDLMVSISLWMTSAVISACVFLLSLFLLVGKFLWYKSISWKRFSMLF